MVELWFLVVMYYTPGGDYISNRVFEFNDYRTCAQERSKVEKTRYPFNQRIQARCVPKERLEQAKNEYTISRTLLRTW